MSTMHRLALVLLLLGAATPTPAAVVEVRLEDFRFVPNDVTIQPGDTVRWINQMGFHDVRADDGSFSRPQEDAPWTFERTFTRAGEVFVHCSVHSVPGLDINSAMNGRINVANITVVPGCRGRVANISVSNNTIFGGPDSGTPYTGTLRGTNGNDVIVGTDANDSINGARGNDTICGGAGRDTLRGAQGRDQLFGEGGRDRLVGGSGRDLCDGGKGRDRVSGCQRLKSIP